MTKFIPNFPDTPAGVALKLVSERYLETLGILRDKDHVFVVVYENELAGILAAVTRNEKYDPDKYIDPEILEMARKHKDNRLQR